MNLNSTNLMMEDNQTDVNPELEAEASDDMNIIIDAFWTLLYSLMLFFAILGNGIVMWIVTAHRRMWTVTNSFIVNLSIADLLNSILNCIFSFSSMKSRTWIFGETFCTVNHFIAYSTVCASAFTLSAISVDRHISILRPNHPHLATPTAVIILVAVWVLSIVVAIPPAMYSGFETTTKNGAVVSYCFLLWPDGVHPVSYYDYAYNIFFTIVTYLIPMLQMLVSYSHMSYILWRTNLFIPPAAKTEPTNGSITSRRDSYMAQQSERAIVNKRKLVKMFITVVVVFGICWLPYHAYFIYTYHFKEAVTRPAIQHVYLAFYFLAMANSMINPIIYYFMNARFRFYFRSLLMQLKQSMFDRWMAVDVSTSFELEHLPVHRPPR